MWLLAKRCRNEAGYLLSALHGVIIKEPQDNDTGTAFSLTSARSSQFRRRVTQALTNYSRYTLQMGGNMLEHPEAGLKLEPHACF